MAQAIASRTRTQIRQSIGRNTSMGIFGTASGAGSTSTLVDTYGLVKYADDALIGYQVYLVVTATGAIEKAWVTDNVQSTGVVTFAPVRTSTTSAQVYELWKRPYFTEEIHDLIDQVTIDASDEAFSEKADTTISTQKDRYDYAMPSGMVGVHKVEYVSSDDNELLSDCNTVWTAGSNSTIVIDTEQHRVGSGCNRISVAVGASTNETVATFNLPATTDLTPYDTIELWVKSSVALTAGDYSLIFYYLTTVDTMTFPAIEAYKWTKLQLTSGIGYSPIPWKAVNSLLISQVADKGAMVLWIDDVKAVNSSSRLYREIPVNFWSVIRGSTPYLKLSDYGRALSGTNTLLRLTGYEKPDLMTADTSTSEVDPDYIVNVVTAKLLMQDPNRKDEAKMYFAMADKIGIRTALNPYTRMVT